VNAPKRTGTSPRNAARALRAPMRGKIRILFLDVDGTLTDGVIGETPEFDFRNFWVRDGLALQWARELGVLPVSISGRPSLAVESRMKDLGLEYYVGIADKVAVAETVLAREGATWAECVMVGDDLPDVPMMKRVGWPIAVADATAEVRPFSRAVTRARAGFGAVREVVEAVLKHNGVWQRVLERYEAVR
jgi:3-deoxy-D-manno-octulosonate 8-phosphate phosphatase (KDO 8-P phosphatase)